MAPLGPRDHLNRSQSHRSASHRLLRPIGASATNTTSKRPCSHRGTTFRLFCPPIVICWFCRAAFLDDSWTYSAPQCQADWRLCPPTCAVSLLSFPASRGRQHLSWRLMTRGISQESLAGSRSEPRQRLTRTPHRVDLVCTIPNTAPLRHRRRLYNQSLLPHMRRGPSAPDSLHCLGRTSSPAHTFLRGEPPRRRARSHHFAVNDASQGQIPSPLLNAAFMRDHQDREGGVKCNGGHGWRVWVSFLGHRTRTLARAIPSESRDGHRC